MATVRAGILLSNILPKLQNLIEKIKFDLTKLGNLKNLQTSSCSIIYFGLKEVQLADNELTRDTSSRKDLSKSFHEDPSKTAERQLTPYPLFQMMNGHIPFLVNGE